MHDLISISKGISKLPFYFGQKFSKTSAYIDLLISSDEDGVVPKTYQELAARWKWHRNTVVSFLEDLRDLKLVTELHNLKIVVSRSKEVDNVNTFKTDSKSEIGSQKPENEEVSSTVQNTFKTDSTIEEKQPTDPSPTSSIIYTNKHSKLEPIVNPATSHQDTTSSHVANHNSNASSVSKGPRRAATKTGEKVKKVSNEQKLEERLKTEEEKMRKLDEGEHSPMMPIGIHLLCTRRKFPNHGALKQHIHANVRAARKLRYYTPKQIATACVAAMAEAKALGGYEIHLETVFKKMALCDKTSSDPKINEYIAAVVARYDIEKSTILSRNSTLIASGQTQAQTPHPTT